MSLFSRTLLRHITNLPLSAGAIRPFSVSSSLFSSTSTVKPPSSTDAIDSKLKQTLDDFVKQNKIAIFIKGEPEAPRCGFSNAVIQILNLHGCQFKSKDILSDEQLRQNLKIYSNWPTFPQIYFNGEFIGGCDILLDMHRSGELVQELNKIGIKSKLADVEKNNSSQTSN
ncbi:unnamed protein product [Didymodactylos carnosus]|uniref:Glutaredoxin-related protein 5, mitochondrial n=1 Tax=Didymodactylos carnosus TaxID=1234261 RepID=A0A813V4S3_9BILA|nr:unnamed protein product [Didymodactylos carnosus]CAF0835159.1 unnamed protein product [Didymodactylos carnosus]CAF3520114.1 unnamed protein product [Didymodactylos carnosus]CAF3622327.1 unnamed protein product [Didymodactylos carnosus]